MPESSLDDFDGGRDDGRDGDRDDEVRHVFEEGCPRCDAPPARDLDIGAGELADTYALTEDPGITRCRACDTVFDVATGEVVGGE